MNLRTMAISGVLVLVGLAIIIGYNSCVDRRVEEQRLAEEQRATPDSREDDITITASQGGVGINCLSIGQRNGEYKDDKYVVVVKRKDLKGDETCMAWSGSSSDWIYYNIAGYFAGSRDQLDLETDHGLESFHFNGREVASNLMVALFQSELDENVIQVMSPAVGKRVTREVTLEHLKDSPIPWFIHKNRSPWPSYREVQGAIIAEPDLKRHLALENATDQDGVAVTVSAVVSVLNLAREFGLYKGLFGEEGILQDEKEYPRSTGYTRALISTCNKWHWVYKKYADLPIASRRAILEIAAPYLAEFAISYMEIPTSDVERYQTELNYRQDVVPISPELFGGFAAYADDHNSRFWVPNISLTDIRFRLFWQRREQWEFRSFKKALKERMAGRMILPDPTPVVQVEDILGGAMPTPPPLPDLPPTPTPTPTAPEPYDPRADTIPMPTPTQH